MAHNHPMPRPDPSRCSCCLKLRLPQAAVVCVNTIPERILDEDGNEIAKSTISGGQAYFHPDCFTVHLGRGDQTLICKECGFWKMARRVPTEKGEVPVAQVCLCQCHSGLQPACSRIRLYQPDTRVKGDDSFFNKWREGQK